MFTCLYLSSSCFPFSFFTCLYCPPPTVHLKKKTEFMRLNTCILFSRSVLQLWGPSGVLFRDIEHEARITGFTCPSPRVYRVSWDLHMQSRWLCRIPIAGVLNYRYPELRECNL